MQIVSIGDNLHEMPNPTFWENKKIVTNLSSAEKLAQSDKLCRKCRDATYAQLNDPC